MPCCRPSGPRPAHVKGLRLVLAPRHPERVPEVERLLAQRGLPSVRRSALPSALGGPPRGGRRGAREAASRPSSSSTPWASWPAIYAAADVVFVGGSLVPAGGHNMLEPALRRKPVLFGPHVENFRDSADLLVEAGGAMVVQDADDLGHRLAELLDVPRPPSRHGPGRGRGGGSPPGRAQRRPWRSSRSSRAGPGGSREAGRARAAAPRGVGSRRPGVAAGRAECPRRGVPDVAGRARGRLRIGSPPRGERFRARAVDRAT